MPNQFLLYGASGFVREVIARLAVQKGLKPILAGRNAAKIEALARELDLPFRVFDLEDSASVDAALRQVPAVLHCAGPYVFTAKQMVDGCLRSGAHYLDLSGGIVDLHAIVSRDAEAKAKQIMLLPGCGFDVVPTDCLALHLKERLPSATHLRLAWRAEGSTKLPPGPLNTMLNGAARSRPGVMVRLNGQLKYVEPGWRMVDFGDGPVKAVLALWGDVFASFYSTGIPKVEEYVAWTEQQIIGMKVLGRMRPLLRFAVVRNCLRSMTPTGPTVEERTKSRALV